MKVKRKVVSMCAMGAIAIAAEANNEFGENTTTPEKSRTFEVATDALRSLIGGSSIPRWNDDDDRTEDEVRESMLLAAKDLRNSVNFSGEDLRNSITLDDE